MNELLDSKEKALAWLYQAELHNLMAIDLLERDRVEICYAGVDSLLLCDSETMLIHCKNQAEWKQLLPILLDRLDPSAWYILKAHEDWYLAELMAKTGFTKVSEVYNGIYRADLALPKSCPEGLEIRPLTLTEFSFVRAVYTTVDDDVYITERIKEGMLGAWYKGDLAGFMGTHSDGSMGLLEVLPKYRRLGIGKALEFEMIRKLRHEGRRTYGNIFKANALSLLIHKKIGTLLSQEPVYWLFRPEE